MKIQRENENEKHDLDLTEREAMFEQRLQTEVDANSTLKQTLQSLQKVAP